MSGHAILDSCHNCGARNEELFLVSASGECCEEPKGAHIHVVAACKRCRREIWHDPPVVVGLFK